MKYRAQRRNLVVWSSSVGSTDKYGAPRLMRRVRTRRIRRAIRMGALLTVIGLMRLARAVRPRWRPLLAGVVLTAVGVTVRTGTWGTAVLPGFMFLVSALLIPGNPDADRERRSQLERQLAVYSTPGQRRDLKGTLDRYPDSVTYELRDILAGQAVTAHGNGMPDGARPRVPLHDLQDRP
jgi:hypothetical protein